MNDYSELHTAHRTFRGILAPGKEVAPTLVVTAESLAALTKYVKHLEEQVSDLQAGQNRLVAERRRRVAVWQEQTLRSQVAEFHEAFGVVTPSRPKVPGDADVRLRWCLIVEEVLEGIAATFDVDNSHSLDEAIKDLALHIKSGAIKVDMPELADALGDIAYVVEGTAQAFGIDSAPIAKEIHRSNMAKRQGGARHPNGKIAKPPGWTPPAIADCLKAQGWQP